MGISYGSTFLLDFSLRVIVGFCSPSLFLVMLNMFGMVLPIMCLLMINLWSLMTFAGALPLVFTLLCSLPVRVCFFFVYLVGRDVIYRPLADSASNFKPRIFSLASLALLGLIWGISPHPGS
jgi:hypothetical protein